MISSCPQCRSLRQDLTRARESVTDLRLLLGEERQDNAILKKGIVDGICEIDTLKRTVGEAVSEIDRLTMQVDRLRKGTERVDAADIDNIRKKFLGYEGGE